MFKPKNVKPAEALKVTNAQKAKFVMTFAWSVAKSAAKKFGGHAKDFLSASMKKAWSLVKASEGGAKISQAVADNVSSLANLPQDMVVKSYIASAIAGFVSVKNSSELLKIFA